MAGIIIIQVILVFICCAGVVRSDPKQQVKEFLDENCKSDDPIGCIDIAKKELYQLSMPRLEPYGKALVQIMNLRDVIDHPRCRNLELYYSLSFIEYSSIGHKRVPDPENLSPFDSLMHFVSLNRAEKCRDIYVQNFSNYYLSVSDISKELVEGFKHKELVEDQASMSKREYMEWLIDYEFDALSEQNVLDAVDYVEALSSVPLTRSSAARLFDDYLGQPCLEYNFFLYYQLAKQMRYDAEMFEGKTFYHLDEDRADVLIPLYQTMARTQFCTVFDHQNAFKALFISKIMYRRGHAAPAA